MEPTGPEGSEPGAATPDDWTPWATTEPSADDAPGDSEGEGDAAEVTTATPVASARAKRLAQGEPTGATAKRTPRRQVSAAAVPAPAPHIRAPVSVGGIIATVGGIVAVVGTLLEMVKVSLGVTNLTTNTTLSTTYFETDNGKIVAVLGAVVLVLALATLVRPISSIIPSMVVAACGLAAFGLALSDRLDLSNASDDYRREFFRTNPLRGLVKVTVGPALYVAMAGGLIATIGAVLASRDR